MKPIAIKITDLVTFLNASQKLGAMDNSNFLTEVSTIKKLLSLLVTKKDKVQHSELQNIPLLSWIHPVNPSLIGKAKSGTHFSDDR